MWVCIYLKEQDIQKNIEIQNFLFFFSFPSNFFSSTKQEGSRNIRIFEYPKRATRLRNVPNRAWPAPHSAHSWRYPRSEPHGTLLACNLPFLRLPTYSHWPRSDHRSDPPPLTILWPNKKRRRIVRSIWSLVAANKIRVSVPMEERNDLRVYLAGE